MNILNLLCVFLIRLVRWKYRFVNEFCRYWLDFLSYFQNISDYLIIDWIFVIFINRIVEITTKTREPPHARMHTSKLMLTHLSKHTPHHSALTHHPTNITQSGPIFSCFVVSFAWFSSSCIFWGGTSLNCAKHTHIHIRHDYRNHLGRHYKGIEGWLEHCVGVYLLWLLLSHQSINKYRPNQNIYDPKNHFLGKQLKQNTFRLEGICHIKWIEKSSEASETPTIKATVSNPRRIKSRRRGAKFIRFQPINQTLNNYYKSYDFGHSFLASQIPATYPVILE